MNTQTHTVTVERCNSYARGPHDLGGAEHIGEASTAAELEAVIAAPRRRREGEGWHLVVRGTPAALAACDAYGWQAGGVVVHEETKKHKTVKTVKVKAHTRKVKK